MAKSKNKTLPLIMKTYNKFNSYIKPILNNFIIDAAVKIFFNIISLIKQHSKDLYHKLEKSIGIYDRVLQLNQHIHEQFKKKH